MDRIWGDIKQVLTGRGQHLYQLLLVNVLIYLVVAMTGAVEFLFNSTLIKPWLSDHLSLPASLTQLIFQPWSLISYAFYHESFFHILNNMLFLYWFGLVANDLLGSKRILALYLYGGLAGAVLFLLAYNLLPVLASQSTIHLLGASGAVYAIVVGAAVLAPDYQFNLLLIGPVKIKWIALFYILYSFISIPNGNAGGNIAHIGGAVVGALFISQLRKGNDLGRPVYALIDALFPPRSHNRGNMKVFVNAEYGKRNAQSQNRSNEPSQEDIDRILDKIRTKGLDSLSKDERASLDAYSKRN